MMTGIRTITTVLMIAAAAALFGAGPAGAQTSVTIVGSGPGATAYQMGGAMAATVNQADIGVVMTNRASQGFVANTRMVETGGTEFALTNGIFVYDAQNGRGDFGEMNAKNIRGVGPVATSWFQMAVAKDSGIETYMDLEGKRVNYAQQGSNTEFMTRVIFEQLGIADTISKEYMRWDQAATALVDGTIDAFGVPSPVPVPSILQASASIPVRILSLPDQVMDFFIESNPGYFRDTIEPGSYSGMEEEPFETVAYTIFVTVNQDVPEEVVYNITKATYGPENREYLVSAYKPWQIGLDATKETGFLDQMKAFGMELHPGAARYWRERGLIE